MSDHYLVYITAADLDEARRMGRTLVEERLAACANILGAIETIYWWEGEVQSGNEVALLAKTTAAQVEPLIARTVELHSYDCPCVVATPIDKGNEAFLRWIDTETAQRMR